MKMVKTLQDLEHLDPKVGNKIGAEGNLSRRVVRKTQWRKIIENRESKNVCWVTLKEQTIVWYYGESW